MRHPFATSAIGRPVAPLPAFGGEAAIPPTQGPGDGGQRLFAHRPVPGYPGLHIFVSRPVDMVLADWRRITTVIGASWVVASLALGILGIWLMRTIRAHGLLQERYRALFDSIPHPVIVSDMEVARILAFNDSAARQYGLPSHGREAGERRLPGDFALLAARRGEYSTNSVTVIGGQRYRNGDGNLIDVDMTIRLIEYEGRTALLIIAIDVTARLQADRARQAAEDRLRQSQKMEILGRLTAGVAHDFNNLLMVVQANAEAALEKGNLAPDILKQLVQISDAARRGEDLTRQMLAFSRKQPLRPQPANINDLVVEAGKLLRRTLGEQIEVDAVMADDLWLVNVDRAQFQTSLVKLCVNARDAMPNGGRVLIETRNIHIGEHEAAGGLVGDCVIATVSDTGTGVAPEDREKIFEPFFTTKGAGSASGLGLSVVYGFIKQSKGHIEVTDAPGRGTTIRIVLPRSTEMGLEAVAVRASPPIVGGHERVLVVEDDEQVRGSVVGQLRSLGYTVDEADNGVSGLDAFERSQAPYDLLLSDVIMPGALNGKELADEVTRRWPRTRIVFMSGYTDNVLGDRKVLLLNKPFRKSDLAQTLRRALDDGIAMTAA